MNIDNFVKKNRRILPKTPRRLPWIRKDELEYWESRKRYKQYWKEVFKKIEKKSNETDSPEALGCLEKVSGADNFARDMFSSSFGEVSTSDATTTNIGPSKIIIKEPLLAKRYPLHLKREAQTDTDVEISPRLPPPKESVHMQFVRKPLRDFITWNTKILPPETEEEKDLLKKSHELNNKIANNFCMSMVELDPECSSIFTEDRIIDLFDVKFNEAYKQKQEAENNESQLFLSELKTKVAIEILLENGKPTKEALQAKKYAATKFNSTCNKTFQQEYHEFESLKLVFKGISKLRIVDDFTHWITSNPDLKLPPYLESKKSFSRNKKIINN